MPRVSKLLTPENPALLFYGRLGCGKTAFLSQAGIRCLYIDMDRGLRTAHTFKDAFYTKRQDCIYQDFYESYLRAVSATIKPTMYIKLYAWLVKVRNEVARNPEKCPPIIILDSFTGLTAAAQASVSGMGNHPERNPSKEEWGIIINNIDNILGILKSFPCIKIVGAHEMTITDSDDKTIHTILCPGQKLPERFAGLFDDVFYCDIVKKVGSQDLDYVVTPKATTATKARTRSNAIQGPWLMNDGFVELLERLGYRVKGGDATAFEADWKESLAPKKKLNTQETQ